MIGAYRLVNPWRGTVFGGFVDDLAVTTTDGERFEFHVDDHYPGRDFSRAEVEAWAAGDPLSSAELAVGHGVPEEDDLGHVPARGADPQSWTWYALSGAGESRLVRDARPDAATLAAACRDALRACATDAVPLVDRFELWTCDPATGEPIAVVLTGRTEHEARGTFSPLWRFCRANEHDDASRAFENRLNAVTCPPNGRGGIRYACRLFERLDGVNARRCHEIALRPGASVGEADVPVGLLAEPWLGEWRTIDAAR